MNISIHMTDRLTNLVEVHEQNTKTETSASTHLENKYTWPCRTIWYKRFSGSKPLERLKTVHPVWYLLSTAQMDRHTHVDGAMPLVHSPFEKIPTKTSWASPGGSLTGLRETGGTFQEQKCCWSGSSNTCHEMLTFYQTLKRIHTRSLGCFSSSTRSRMCEWLRLFRLAAHKKKVSLKRGPTGNVYNVLSCNDTERLRNFWILDWLWRELA